MNTRASLGGFFFVFNIIIKPLMMEKLPNIYQFINFNTFVHTIAIFIVVQAVVAFDESIISLKPPIICVTFLDTVNNIRDFVILSLLLC